jgi:uncharacterized protein YbaR (Trm112 family)
MPEQTKRKLRLDKDGMPYAVCPHCHKQIYNLEVVEETYITYEVSPEADGTLQFEETDRDTALDWDYNYTCPECNEVIATSEDEAEALFIGPSQEQEAAQEQGIRPARHNEAIA